MFIGYSIDGLVQSGYKMFYFLFFILACKVFIAFLFRRLDTRIYEPLELYFKQNYYENGLNCNIEISTIDANLNLVQSCSEYLRLFVFNNVYILMGIVIPLCYIFTEAGICVFAFSLIVIIAVLLIQFHFRKSINVLVCDIRDENERRREIIGKNNII